MKRTKIGRWAGREGGGEGCGRLGGGEARGGWHKREGGRAAGGSLRREKEASPARMSYTGAVPPITSGFAKWPPFPAKLDHRGPTHETLAGLRAMCK